MRTQPLSGTPERLKTPTVNGPRTPPPHGRSTGSDAPPHAPLNASSRSWMNATDANGPPPLEVLDDLLVHQGVELGHRGSRGVAGAELGEGETLAARSGSARGDPGRDGARGEREGGSEPRDPDGRFTHGIVQWARMPRIVDRYVLKELGPPFAVGVAVFTFFLVIDRIYSPHRPRHHQGRAVPPGAVPSRVHPALVPHAHAADGAAGRRPHRGRPSRLRPRRSPR